MKYKENIKNILILLSVIIITMLFFSYQVVITYDSSHYLWLTSLLTKEGNFSDWDVARGPIFPMFIRICNILFGQNTYGLVIGMFTFYVIMLVGCYFIYKDTIKNEEFFSKKMKWILGILFVVLIVINPMIIGYYHTLLTEFIAITLSVIGCYLAWKWIDVDFSENKIKYIVYTIILSVLIVVAWQLKQPYVSTILFPVIIATVISFIRQRNFKNFIQRFSTVLICGIALIAGMKMWNFVLAERKCADKRK